MTTFKFARNKKKDRTLTRKVENQSNLKYMKRSLAQKHTRENSRIRKILKGSTENTFPKKIKSKNVNFTFLKILKS